MKKEIVIDGNLYRLVEETEVENPVPSYEQVCKSINGDIYYFISSGAEICEWSYDEDARKSNTSPSKTQLEALLAINKLANVARFVNGDWKCDIDDNYFSIQLNDDISIEELTKGDVYFIGILEFKSREAAERAVEILGEEEIKKCFRLQE